MNGPTVYAQLLVRATNAASEAVAKELHGHLIAVERDISQAMVGMLRQAYLEGVRDGFHQGLAAAANEEPLPASSAAAREEGEAR